MGGLEAADNVLPRLALAVGEVYKKQIRIFCIQEESERLRDFVKMENFLYECIYEVPWKNYPHEQR